MASAAIGSVYANLGINSAEFVMGLKKAQGQLSAFGTSLKAFAGSAAIGALTSLGLAAVRSGAQIGDLAETIGVTAEQIQVYNRLAVASGSSSESMAKGLQSIAEQSVDAESKLSKLFAANGITAKGMAVNEVIQTFTDLLKNARNPAEQLAIATEVLGTRVGRDLIEALREGSAGYDAAMQSMIASGELMSNAEIKRLQELETQYNIVTDRIGAYWMKMVIGISDAASGIMQPNAVSEGRAAYFKRRGTEFGAWGGNAPRSSGPYPDGNTRGPIPVKVTNLPTATSTGGGSRSSGSKSSAPDWLTGSSESPSQGGPVTGYDLRGTGLEIADLADQMDYANEVALDLSDTLVDSLGSAISGLVDGSMSAKEAFADMSKSLLNDLGSITSALLRSGLMGLVQGYGPSAFGAQGLFGTGFGGFYASGGSLGAGKWGIAGEAGPEIIHGPANITPMGMGGTTVNVINQGGGSVEQRKRRDGSGREIVDIIIGVTRQEQARGSKRLLGAGYGVNPALVQR